MLKASNELRAQNMVRPLYEWPRGFVAHCFPCPLAPSRLRRALANRPTDQPFN